MPKSVMRTYVTIPPDVRLPLVELQPIDSKHTLAPADHGSQPDPSYQKDLDRLGEATASLWWWIVQR